MAPTIGKHFVVGQLSMFGINNAKFKVDRAFLLLKNKQLFLDLGIDDFPWILVHFDLEMIEQLFDRDALVVLIGERYLTGALLI